MSRAISKVVNPHELSSIPEPCSKGCTYSKDASSSGGLPKRTCRKIPSAQNRRSWIPPAGCSTILLMLFHLTPLFSRTPPCDCAAFIADRSELLFYIVVLFLKSSHLFGKFFNFFASLARRGRNTKNDRPKPVVFGANGGTRTRDLLITNQLLYQLSHISI